MKAPTPASNLQPVLTDLIELQVNAETMTLSAAVTEPADK